MKRINTFKKLFFVALLGAASAANGQTKAVAYGPVNLGGSGNMTSSNWYKDYVGKRVTVVSPLGIAGDKANMEAVIGTGASEWPNIRDTNLINIPIVMPLAIDSYGVNPFPALSMTGKICVLWRGPIVGAVNFAQKSYFAEQAGALACVIINEYPGEGPIGPGYATGGGFGITTIPVYVIGNLDGIAIATQYALGPVNMTITPWGQNLNQDLGFVPQGFAGWHTNTIPANQLTASTTGLSPYLGLDGAFVANFGLLPATNVVVSDSLSFTPAEGGAATIIHQGVSPTLATFNPIDSIYAMFSATEYPLTAFPGGKGTFNLTYKISSTEVDQSPGDNTVTYSFNTSDSVYSKGRYDLTNQAPIRSEYFQPGGTGATDNFLWGNMYYVANGQSAISSVQFSLANKNGVFGEIGAGLTNVYVFQWVDGDITNIPGNVPDGIVENGELIPVAYGSYDFGLPTDTSELTVKVFMNQDAGGGFLPTGAPAMLRNNSWYLVSVDVPGGYFLGCDGLVDPYPRVYGRYHSSNNDIENSVIDWLGDYNGAQNPMTSNYPDSNFSVGSSQTLYTKSVDSFNFAGNIGFIPAVAMIVNNNPDTSLLHVGVQNVVKPFADVTLSPNPASDHINVSIALEQPASSVTYTIIDGLARFVSKTVHNNVQNESFSISTANMASGTYFLTVNANGKGMTKQFVVIK